MPSICGRSALSLSIFIMIYRKLPSSTILISTMMMPTSIILRLGVVHVQIRFLLLMMTTTTALLLPTAASSFFAVVRRRPAIAFRPLATITTTTTTTTTGSTSTIKMMIPSDPPSSASAGSYSYVEDGDFFESDWNEVEAMGGDPFFLDSSSSSEEDDENNRSSSERKNRNTVNLAPDGSNFESDWNEIGVLGGDPFFLEDPTERDNRVEQDSISLGEEEEEEEEEEVSKTSAVNSILASDGDFASNWSENQATGGGGIKNPWMTSTADGAGCIPKEVKDYAIGNMIDTVRESGFFESDWDEIEFLGGDSSFLNATDDEIAEQTLLSDPARRGNMSSNSENVSDDELFFKDDWDEIESIGGDPSFLVADDKGGRTASGTESSNSTKSNGSKDDDFLWDGEVDEDAYFD